MTLIVSLSGPNVAIMASDRLVTRVDRNSGRFMGEHDRKSNKMVILVMKDAVVSIGYTGIAYIAGKHTDDWIAEKASPGANIFGKLSSAMYGFKLPSELRLHQLCNRLRLGLAANGVDRSTAILITGWRLRRNRLIPVTIIVRASPKLTPESDIRLRLHREPGTTQFTHVGATLFPAELEAAWRSVSGRPLNAETARDMLTNLIRSKAAIDRSVGPHVMSVVIYHPTSWRIDCRFDPLQSHYGSQTVEGQHARLVVGYSPWILTPNTFVAPTETSGAGFGTWEANGWTIDVSDVSRGPPTPSQIGWSLPQQRRSPPR